MRPALPERLALIAAGCRESEVRGPYGESVTAITARSMLIRRGEQQPFEVAIDRQNFSGPVTVSIAQLPKGVSADRSSMKTDATVATFILTAARDASLVENQAVSVTVEGMDGRRAAHYVNLSVTE